MRATLIALVVLAAPQLAAAQEIRPAPVSQTEIGGHITALGGEFLAGGPRFTFNFNRRHAIQTTTDFRYESGGFYKELDAIYTAEYRYTLPVRLADTRVFITAGGLGVLEWEHVSAHTITYSGYTYRDITGQLVTVPATTYNQPTKTYFDGFFPLYPIAGGGIERRINRHLSVRGDGQIIIHDDGLTFRLSGGVTVSLGKLR